MPYRPREISKIQCQRSLNIDRSPPNATRQLSTLKRDYESLSQRIAGLDLSATRIEAPSACRTGGESRSVRHRYSSVAAQQDKRQVLCGISPRAAHGACDYSHIQDTRPWVHWRPSTADTQRYTTMADSYEPRDFMVGPRDVKCGWIVLIVAAIGLVIV